MTLVANSRRRPIGQRLGKMGAVGEEIQPSDEFATSVMVGFRDLKEENRPIFFR
jgi:hypothetical protein